jgi:hypothetical protein
MAKPVFGLHFVAPRKHKDRPFSPRATVAVETFGQDSADGLPFIAAGATKEGFDEAVEALIKDLKRVRSKARRLFDDHEKVFAKSERKK